MALRGTSERYRLAQIERRHFNVSARPGGLGSDMESIVDEVIGKTPRVIEEVEASLPKGFPARLLASVTSGLRKAAKRLGAMSPE